MRWLPALMLVVPTLPGAACAAHAAPHLPAHRAIDAPVVEGVATFYGAAFAGKPTASGVPYDMNAMTAAHPTYPFGTVVRVTNLENGRSVRVRIRDRGPAAGPRAAGVVIDLSRAAAQALDLVHEGRARVRVEVLRWGNRDPDSR